MSSAPHQLRSSLGISYPIGINGARIGRSSSNDIIVDDPRVSRSHAQVLFAGGRYWVRDEGSQQGTFLNGRPLQGQQELRVGDSLQIGAVTFNLVSAPTYDPTLTQAAPQYPMQPYQPNYQQPPQYYQQSKDPSTAFLLELVGGFFGLLGLGYFYAGKSGDGTVRLIGWIVYNFAAWVVISLLLAVFIGVLCLPIQLVIQIAVPIWSASALKTQMTKYG